MTNVPTGMNNEEQGGGGKSLLVLLESNHCFTFKQKSGVVF